MSRAYLLGALHDATERKYTYRLAQKEKEYVDFIAEMVRRLGFKAWIYHEGKGRNLYVVEFNKRALEDAKIKTRKEKIEYARGYFDAEGSVPTKKDAFFYIYLAQNNKKDLLHLRKILESLGIRCGKMHRPSKKKNKQWRFYVRADCRKKFAKLIGSSHPRKSQLLRKMI